MPFDETTRIGYALTMIVQLIGSWVICLIICNVNSFFYGVCWYIETMLSDMFTVFDDIDEYLDKFKGRSNPIFIELRLKEAILFHTQILR